MSWASPAEPRASIRWSAAFARPQPRARRRCGGRARAHRNNDEPRVALYWARRTLAIEPDIESMLRECVTTAIRCRRPRECAPRLRDLRGSHLSRELGRRTVCDDRASDGGDPDGSAAGPASLACASIGAIRRRPTCQGDDDEGTSSPVTILAASTLVLCARLRSAPEADRPSIGKPKVYPDGEQHPRAGSKRRRWDVKIVDPESLHQELGGASHPPPAGGVGKGRRHRPTSRDTYPTR